MGIARDLDKPIHIAVGRAEAICDIAQAIDVEGTRQQDPDDQAGSRDRVVRRP